MVKDEGTISLCRPAMYHISYNPRIWMALIKTCTGKTAELKRDINVCLEAQKEKKLKK